MDREFLAILRKDPTAIVKVADLLEESRRMEIIHVRNRITEWNRWANDQLKRRGKGAVGLGPDLLTHFLPNATPSKLALGVFVDVYLRVLIGSLLRDIDTPTLRVQPHEFHQIGAALQELSRSKLVLVDFNQNHVYVNSFMFSGRMIPVTLAVEQPQSDTSEWDDIPI